MLYRYDRRRFLAGMAAVAGSVAMSGCGGGGGDPGGGKGGDAPAPSITNVPSPNGGDRYSLPRAPLPDPANSGIDFVVLVTMENRSFDHFLSWVPGAEGMPANQHFVDAFGTPQSPFPLSANPAYGYQACAYHDPNHSYAGGRTQLASGAMNGWLLTPGTNQTQGDLLPIGYYTSADLEFFSAVASNYTIADYGEAFLAQVYNALRTSPIWNRTLMIVVYDEWGGFIEHVVPPVRPISKNELAIGNDGRLGFRAPLALLGPRVRAGTLTRYPFDPSSIHALLQWRFGLSPLGVRGSDSATVNLAYALDFAGAPRTDASAFNVAQGPFDGACPGAPAASGTLSAIDKSPLATNPTSDRFADLRAKAAALGFNTGS
ncbi:alkaline phosphatase family protein [Paraburkholderia sacchari]|uniref:alkaline phosphatase family protein n=1 Tax=Paraburkholderia sacchari TaxID=159450 RepID=UPI000541CC47|nr:alkaline phosphatase family protein [Paraburkholderia sacchari]NLP63692.1 phosphoesterase [Paraburkholderia sacchari]